MQQVTSADGTSIAYERHGDGPPLILLHGGSSPRYWEPVVPRFADDYSVVVPHRRGVGASEDTDEYSLEKGVQDVRAVIDEIGGDPVLFGHSFGGLLAIEAARTAPADKLVVYEPAVLVGEYRNHADLAGQMQTRIDEGNRRDAMRLYIREVIHGGEIEDLDAWLSDWPPWPDIVGLTENIVRINRAIERYRLPDSLGVDVPTLLLTGTDGPPHLRESIHAVHESLPNSRLTEFEGVGHGGPSEAPERVTAEVREFIEDPESGDASGWPWPDSLDAINAAPDSHHVLMENDRVRVVEVVIPPDEKEPYHTHRWPSVMLVDRAARIRYYDESRNVAYESPERNDSEDSAERSPPETEWMSPEGPHAVENIDSVPYHAIRIELKR